MTHAVRATVIVVAYNSADHLGLCLDTLLPTLGPDDEALVYDGGSSDDSAAVARRHGARVARSTENRGFAGSNNRAARIGRGRYLVFLNPDTAVESGWLEPLLAPLADGPAMTTAKIVLMDDPSRLDTCANSVHLSGITVCRGHGQPADSFAEPERVLAVSGAAFAIDRATFERLGGFDERFFMYLEDTDLSLRAALAGVPCWYVPASRVRHRHAPAFGARKLHWLERNRWAMLLKVWSGATLLRLLPTLLLVEAMTWGYALLSGPSGLRAKASASFWLVGHARYLAKARRRAQALRRVHDAELLARCAWRLDLTELVAGPRLRYVVGLGLAPALAVCRAFLRLGPSRAQSAASSA